MSDFSDDDDENQDMYDFLRELNTGVDEGAAVYHDPAYRCFHLETNRSEAEFYDLPDADKWSFQRPPRIAEPRVPKGAFFRYNPYDNSIVRLTASKATRFWWTSFESK